MAGSTFGHLFSMITFGESHGPYIGVVIDGIRPGIPIDEEEIQREMQRRRPGQSEVTTPRQESDRAMIISGVFEGKTTGTPLCILVRNEDQRSKDYSNIRDIYRPGHASYTFLKKYGIFDYRGGGRSSGRETASRVAAGAVAKQILRQYGISFHAFTRKIGPYEAKVINYDVIESNPVRCPDADVALQMVEYIRSVAEEGDSVGGIVELHIKGIPSGLGDPVFGKLDAELGKAMLSIGAVKGVEFGSGFAVSSMKGSENNDPFTVDERGIHPATNKAGGVLGGISTGEDVILRLAVKPPSSIRKKQLSVTHDGEFIDFSIEGRHDPCICPRVVPVAEAMAALVILDLLLIQQQIQQPVSSMEFIRREIDLVDRQLLLLIHARNQLARKLGNMKKRSGVDIVCPEREREILTQLETDGRILGLPSEVIQTIWRELFQLSYAAQQEGESDEAG